MASLNFKKNNAKSYSPALINIDIPLLLKLSYKHTTYKISFAMLNIMLPSSLSNRNTFPIYYTKEMFCPLTQIPTGYTMSLFNMWSFSNCLHKTAQDSHCVYASCALCNQLTLIG